MVQLVRDTARDPMAYAEFIRGYRLSSSGDPGDLRRSVSAPIQRGYPRSRFFSGSCRPVRLCARLSTLNSIPRAFGWRRPSFIAAAHWNWIRICPKGTSPALFSCGVRRKTSNTLKQLPNLSKRLLSRTINLKHTTVWARSSHTSVCSTTHAKCMRGGGRSIPEKRSATVSCKSTFGSKNTTWRGKRFKAWRAESPDNKYQLYFGPQLAMMTGNWKEARTLLDEAIQCYLKNRSSSVCKASFTH